MAKILSGAPVKEKIKKELIEMIKRLKTKPFLAIVQVGDRSDSNVYVKNKMKFGEEIGVKTIIERLKIEGLKDLDKKEKELIQKIKELNENEKINGIIVQLPLPVGFDTEKILNLIDKKKDADGLVDLKIERLKDGKIEENEDKKIIPATARGVVTLLDFYEISVKNKKVAMVGQGILAGKPIATELEKREAEVFRCDINTKNIPEIASSCDILVSAVGKRNLITKDFVNKNQTIIDIGNDVDFEEVEKIVAAITPVPGGVGPLTVACLFQNLLDLISFSNPLKVRGKGG